MVIVKARLPASPSRSVAVNVQVAAPAAAVGVPHTVRAAPQVPVPSRSNVSPAGRLSVADEPGPASA